MDLKDTIFLSGIVISIIGIFTMLLTPLWNPWNQVAGGSLFIGMLMSSLSQME